MRHSLSLFFGLCSLGLAAQTEGPNFTVTGTGIATTLVTDYQVTGINPANLGLDLRYEDPRFAFGFLEIGYSVYSDGVTRKVLRHDILQDFDATFTGNEQQQAAENFSNSALALNGDVRLFGFSFQHDKAGGFAISVGDRFNWASYFNETTSELLFQGRTADYFPFLQLANDTSLIPNDPGLSDDTLAMVVAGVVPQGQGKKISQLMDDTRMTHSWTREYALSWGRRMFVTGSVEWQGGIGLRYLQGLGYIDIGEKDGKWQGVTALTPAFNIDYGTAAITNPSTITGGGMKSVGSGFSGDVGITAVIKDVVKIGVAATNMGSMTWNGNVYKAKDDTLYSLSSPGFTSYNFFDQAEVICSDLGIFDWEGVKDIKVATPSTLRTGASYMIKKKAEIGLDVVIPLNDVAGNLAKPQFSVGGEYSPVEFMTLQMGIITGGNYDTRMPMGILFRMPSGQWEGGVSTRDMLSYFGQNTPTVSLCVGVLRFRV